MERYEAKENEVEAYEDALKDIKLTIGILLDQFKVIPKDVVAQEWAGMKKYTFEETKIPAKYRELIGLGIAAAIRCPYCIHFHTHAAKMNGASDEELAEVAYLTRITTGWSAILHAADIDLETFKEQMAKVEEHLSEKEKQ